MKLPKGWKHYLPVLKQRVILARSFFLLFLVLPAFFEACTSLDVPSPGRLPSPASNGSPTQGEGVVSEFTLLYPPYAPPSRAASLSSPRRAIDETPAPKRHSRAIDETPAPKRHSRAIDEIPAWALVRRLDVFVFDDDKMRRLDSYSRSGLSSIRTIRVESGGGNKILVVTANIDYTEEQILGILTLEDLEHIEASYAADDPEHPIMSGVSYFKAGTDGSGTVVLQPILSEIEIRAIEAEGVDDISAYLLNIPSSCPILSFDEIHPNGYYHLQRFREGDMRRLSVPSMSYRYIGEPFISDSYYLYSYPNQVEEESPGSPFTRLVIEGQKNGQTHYWGVNINRRGYGYSTGAEGIGRNIRYSMTLRLVSDGSANPDKPSPEANEVEVRGSMAIYPGTIISGEVGTKVHLWCEVYPEDTEVVINRDDLEYEKSRGLIDYSMDTDGHGAVLRLLSPGTSLINVDCGPPVSDGSFVILVIHPGK
ncbi:MAG: FimB/Mfa2 family fimbrial subunit [Bacteroidales bacterium]|nr:FimB/Mfa2 family fimbrial subunit [Bacteroidales bacterium]